LEPRFLEVIHEHTAGDPQRDIRWTNLRQREIARRMTAAAATPPTLTCSNRTCKPWPTSSA
jgi:hypothetical protein